MSESTRRHWWRLVGPWQIRPGLLTGVAFLYYLTYRAGQQGSMLLFDPTSVTGTIIPGLAAAAVVYGIGALGRAWQGRRGIDWVSYLVTLGAMTAVSVAFRVAVLSGTPAMSVGANLAGYGRFLFTFMLTSAVAGVIVSRLEAQVTATQEALRVAREQQVQLIAADEEARRQVSLLLHDRVQAGLLTTCLELRGLAPALPPGERSMLEGLIERLEAMRVLDVRQAARVLSPNLEEVDLQTALEDLAAQYEAIFTTEVVIDPADERELSERWPFTALAIYRIVDQGLINVAAHAAAESVIVRVERASDGFRVSVQDDGRGIAEPQRPGLGSTLITTWVRATEGEWSLLPNTGMSGATLTATLQPMESMPSAHHPRSGD